MKEWFGILGFMILVHPLWTGESITGNDSDYLEVCEQAATEQWYFDHFRSLYDYNQVTEIGCGDLFADFLKNNASQEIFINITKFEKLDRIGKPLTLKYYEGLGNFSGATLRYITIADQIKKLFLLPDDAKIVELGAGFGGQCYILSHLQSFSDYYILDLPEVEPLIEKVLNTLEVKNVTYSCKKNKVLENDVDLFISNYAFSECDRETQLEYFEKVIKKCKRGYVIYNQIAERIFGLDSLSPIEFFSLLQKNNMNPKLYNEPVRTAVDNVLIIWDNV